MKRHWQGPAALLLLQASKVAYFLRDCEFPSPWPLLGGDFSLMYTRAAVAARFFPHGRLWGYDPNDMGGYIAGLFHDVGNHAFSLLTFVLSPLIPLESALLFLEVAGMFAAPLIILAVVRGLGGDWRTSWTAYAVMIAIEPFYEPITGHIYLHGLFGYRLSSYLSLWLLTQFLRFVPQPTFRRWAIWTLGTTVALYLHQGALITLGFGAISVLLFHARLLRARHAVWLAGSLAVLLLLNWPWIHPFSAFEDWLVRVPYLNTSGPQAIRAIFVPKPHLFWIVQSAGAWVVLGFAVWTLIRLYRTDRRKADAFAFTMVFLAEVAFFGSNLPVVHLSQPARYILPLIITTVTLASFSVVSLWSSALRSKPARALALAAIALLWCLPLSVDRRNVPMRGRSRMHNFLWPQQERLIHYVKTHGPFAGRLLVEAADGPPHLIPHIPLRTGQPVIGGSNPGNFLRARFTVFDGSHRQDVATAWDMRSVVVGEPRHRDRLRDYLRLYNVSHIAVQSQLSKQAFNRLSGVRLIADLDGYSIYEFSSPGGWLLKGTGRVTATYDTIVVDDAGAGELILKFHWIRTFKAEPPVALTPVLQMKDPVPFIKIDNSGGARRLVLRND